MTAGASAPESLVQGVVARLREWGASSVNSLAGDPETLAESIRAEGKPLEFTILSAEQNPVRLIPYHRIAHERYATYWRLNPSIA